MSSKLFTLAIPTYNRPEYLDICLKNILVAHSNLSNSEKHFIEILISDNSENNLSSDVVNQSKYDSLNITYIKNNTNIGSDQNLANCYIKSSGEYVSLMGDDDFVEGDYFTRILPIIKEMQYMVIFLKVFGYTFSENEKRPNSNQKNIIFKTPIDALLHRNIQLGFISGLILRRDKINEQTINNGVGTNLVQVNACLHILSTHNKDSIYIPINLVGTTRNNTGGYNPVKVLYENYFELLNKFDNLGLSNLQLDRLKNKMLYTFYSRNFAQYIRANNSGLSTNDFKILDKSFHNNFFYKYFIRKLFKNTSRLNFNLLNIIFTLSNLIYNPYRLADFLKHATNIIIKSLKFNN